MTIQDVRAADKASRLTAPTFRSAQTLSPRWFYLPKYRRPRNEGHFYRSPEGWARRVGWGGMFTGWAS